jgi:hypothetical protein
MDLATIYLQLNCYREEVCDSQVCEAHEMFQENGVKKRQWCEIAVTILVRDKLAD